MLETIYRIEGVVKTYGNKEVCFIEHLEICKGEIFCIMGPNGAGKSTLLRLLNFLEPPTSGTIYFKGHKFSNNSQPPLSLRRQITTVFQDSVLLTTSVEANVAYGLKLRHHKDSWQKVKGALEKVGLSSLAKAKVSTLSGGEAQRVALARALVIEPEVLLLDEPTANLDPYNVNLIEDLIVSVNREHGTSIVLVTHNIFQARRIAHRVAFLLNGRAVEVGETEKIFSHPTDPRTAAFIRGEMVY